MSMFRANPDLEDLFYAGGAKDVILLFINARPNVNDSYWPALNVEVCCHSEGSKELRNALTVVFGENNYGHLVEQQKQNVNEEEGHDNDFSKAKKTICDIARQMIKEHDMEEILWNANLGVSYKPGRLLDFPCNLHAVYHICIEDTNYNLAINEVRRCEEEKQGST